MNHVRRPGNLGTKGSHLQRQVGPAGVRSDSANDAARRRSATGNRRRKTWKMIWHDEFDGTTLDESKWVYRPDGKRKDGRWGRKAVRLDGRGHLAINGQATSRRPHCPTSSSWTTCGCTTWWRRSEKAKSDEEVVSYVRTCNSHQAAMTFNVGIYQDGTMASASVEQLHRLGVALGKA